MANKGNRTLSISINNEYIKICELSRKNNKLTTIHKAVTVPTPPRCYNDGTIRDRAELAKAIKVAIDSNRMESTKTIFSIASSKVATKEVIIPNVKNNKIADIIMTNASEYFPVNLDEYIINFEVLEKLEYENQDTKIKVLVMAMPEAMINAYYDLAGSLGLEVKAIDYVGNSTYQTLKLQVDNSPSIVIQVENDATIVNILDNNVLQLQRTIPYGKSVVVNALMDSMRIKYDPALKMLQDQQLIHASFDGDPVTESLNYLVTNVNRILDYYVTRNSNRPIEKAYIIGNATTMLGFKELFTNELKLPIESIDELAGVVTDKKTYVEAVTIPTYIINIGAFLKPVNFVPRSVQDEVKSKDDIRIFKVILGASIVGSVVIIVSSFAMMMSAKAERDSAQSSVNQVKGIESVVNSYYEAKDTAADALAFQILTYNNNDSLAGFITSLEQNLPSDVTIKSMSSNSGEVTMSGVTSSKSSLALLVQRLKSVKNVQDVLIGSEAEVEDNEGVKSITFSMTCTFTLDASLNPTQSATQSDKASSQKKTVTSPSVAAATQSAQRQTGSAATPAATQAAGATKAR